MNQQTQRTSPALIRLNTMKLADNLTLDVNTIIGQQIACFGVPGSGKTNTCALFLEQVAPFMVPLAIFDKEGDLASLVDYLPRGVLATASNCPSGADILKHGLQVVYDLASWQDDHDRAGLICNVTNGLMSYADTLDNADRVPCLVVLDEAHYWLPERAGSQLDGESYKELRSTFSAVSSTGRKRGVTPFLICPRMSNLAKSVLSPGLFIFHRASLDIDLDRYLEYVHSNDLTGKQLKRRIAAFPAGRAIVVLPNGSQKVVNFHTRQSEHKSHTPTVDAALARYSSMAVPSQPYGPLGESVAVVEASPAPVAIVKPVEIQHAAKPVTAVKGTVKGKTEGQAKMRRLLKRNPNCTPSELAAKIGVSSQTIRLWRKELGLFPS